MADKKKRFGAPPPSNAADIDAFINGSSTDSQEKIKHDNIVATAPIAAPVTEKPADTEAGQAAIAAEASSTPETADKGDTKPADMPKRGRPSKKKELTDSQQGEGNDDKKPSKILFELPFKESEDLREHAFNTRKSKAEILRQALKEYLKRNH